MNPKKFAKYFQNFAKSGHTDCDALPCHISVVTIIFGGYGGCHKSL